MKKIALSILAIAGVLFFACAKPEIPSDPNDNQTEQPGDNPGEQPGDNPGGNPGEQPGENENPGGTDQPGSGDNPTVYDIFLCIGQSNMAGRGEMIDSDRDSINGVWLLKPDGSIEKATNPLNKYSSVRKDLSMQQISPAFGFCTYMHEKTEKPILLVVNAKGGTGIGNWVPGSSSDTLYNAALRRTRQALAYGELKGIIWHQGESNASTWSSYMASLKTMVEAFRKDLGKENLPFVAGEIHHYHSNSMYFNKMIQAIAENIPNTAWVSAYGLTLNSDMLHHDRESQITLGERYGEAMYRLAYDNSAPAPAVQPELYVEPRKITLESASGSEATATLVTNQSDISVSIPEDAASWLSVKVGSDKITFTASSEAQSGESRTAVVRFSAQKEYVDITVTQKAASKYSIGQVWNNQGVIFWINPENPDNFKVISAKAEKRAWGPKDKINGVNSSSIAGPEAADKVRAADDYSTASYAQQFCDQLGEGWYIPNRDEGDALFLAYDSETYFAKDKSGTATQDVPDKCTDKEKAARTAFDNALTSVEGGVKLNTADWSETGESIWLCYETSKGLAYYYRYGSPGSSTGTKSSTSRWARCVKEIK